MKPTTIYKTDQFKIISHGNGWGYEFISFDRMQSIWVQDSDAIEFESRLTQSENNNPHATVNALLSFMWFQYDELAEKIDEPKDWPLLISYKDMLRA